jgi:hypothetical protein
MYAYSALHRVGVEERECPMLASRCYICPAVVSGSALLASKFVLRTSRFGGAVTNDRHSHPDGLTGLGLKLFPPHTLR